MVHRIGTNRKTSTARMVETLLRGLGLRTGRFTSPHLESITERISVEGEPLTEQRFAEVYAEVAPYAESSTARVATLAQPHARSRPGVSGEPTKRQPCVRHAGAGRRKTVETVTTWGSMTGQILALREHLAAEPFYYLLEDLPGVEVMLVNARHVKTVPGRKTDVADATWLAHVWAGGCTRIRLWRGSRPLAVGTFG